MHVTVETCLINCVDRTKTHGNGWEFPEIWHQTWVRIRRQSAAFMREFLAEAIHLMFGEAAFHKCTCIHARRSVALEENLISAACVIFTAEEMVETNLVERSG